MSHVITVRHAVPEDAEAIHRIYTSPKAASGTLQSPYGSVQPWHERLATPSGNHYHLVAVVQSVTHSGAPQDAELVGNIGLHLNTNARRRHSAHIGMGVRDDWQGQGIGSQLMAAVIDLADHWLGLRRLELTVFSDNAIAIALYKKYDFTIEGTLKQYALRHGHFIDAYHMARLQPAETSL